MAEFGEILKQTIEKRGVTQRWVAENANTTEATISRYTSQIHKPPILDTLKDISRCLNVSVDYLIGLTNVETANPSYSVDVKLLLVAYNRASLSDRNVIWALLSKYLNESERAELTEQIGGQAF